MGPFLVRGWSERYWGYLYRSPLDPIVCNTAVCCEDAVADLTRCEQLRAAMSNYEGAYQPQCDENGEFAPMQCNDATGECWCVRPNGQDIPGTITREPHRPVCSREGRLHAVCSCPVFALFVIECTGNFHAVQPEIMPQHQYQARS